MRLSSTAFSVALVAILGLALARLGDEDNERIELISPFEEEDYEQPARAQDAQRSLFLGWLFGFGDSGDEETSDAKKDDNPKTLAATKPT